MEESLYQSQYGIEGIVTARTITRGLALHGMSALYKLTGRMEALARNREQFIYLHHLFPEEEESFRNLIRALGRDHCLVSFSEAVDRVKSGNIDKPYVCFSFDDGLQQNLPAGKILHEFGISGCFFICPSFVGEKDRRKLKEICENRFAMPAMDLLSWDEVEEMVKDGHEIGSHTMNHPVLSRISEAQMQDEIAESRQVLTRRLGEGKHFAWPEGRFFHFTPTAAKLVYDAGYDSCVSAERGCHISQPSLSNFCIRRDYISARWPLGHSFYFLAKNSLSASAGNPGWPEPWIQDVALTTAH
jgi:peptidoglycan/xylan/chitin deacetylase (PgdA/CDA1 family)